MAPNSAGWGNPIVGGTSLRIPAIRSPNYVLGSTGWTINIDGSAEFNNLTIRGTFNGTNFVINSTGAFFYSGTPAAGNLIASIVPGAAGTDSFGNHYVQGYGSYDNTLNTFAQILGSKILTGQTVTGVPDTSHAGGMDAFNTAHGALFLLSGLDPSFPTTDQAQLLLNSGLINSATGSGSNPTVTFADSAGNSAVDVLMSGTAIKATNAGVANTWQTPSLGAGWSIAAINGTFPLQYRFTVEDCTRIFGNVEATSTTPAATIFTLPMTPTNYTPALPTYFPIEQLSSSGAHKGFGGGLVNHSGGVAISTTGLTIVAGDIFHLDINVPLGHIA